MLTSFFSRRSFILQTFGLLVAARANGKEVRQRKNIMTVKGLITEKEMGITLPHEHVLVDFVGAAMSNENRWVKEDVVKKMLPFINEAKLKGCRTFVDCTPSYLGRDPVLLQWLSELSEINFITNTGYYGGSDHKFLPEHAFSETPEQLADRWLKEWKDGIGSSSVRPGFIKISVNPGPLTPISKKLITASALTHLESGLTIASHTGPAEPAIEQIQILTKNGVSPEAFIWVHAQQEKSLKEISAIARRGAWISLDGLNESVKGEDVQSYVERLIYLKKLKVLNRILISHDAGWYDPAKTGGGDVRGYTTLFTRLIPELEKQGFEERDVLQLIEKNPQNAFEIGVKKRKPGRKTESE